MCRGKGEKKPLVRGEYGVFVDADVCEVALGEERDYAIPPDAMVQQKNILMTVPHRAILSPDNALLLFG